jgi:hypothetical protein
VELSKETFDAQEHALYELLALPAVRRCCIDQSGLGRQFAERATKKFGVYKVEEINFTQGTKEELAYPVRVAFEDRTIKVPFTNAVRADLRGVRKEITGSGHIRFAGEKNRFGHCDRFWALALALHAAKKPTTGAITSVEGIRYRGLPYWRRGAYTHQGCLSQRQDLGASRHKRLFSQPLGKGEQSGLQTRIAATESRFVVHADKILTAFLELESAIRAGSVGGLRKSPCSQTALMSP